MILQVLTTKLAKRLIIKERWIMSELRSSDFQDMIILAGLNKKFGDFTAVNDLNVNVKKGDFLTLLGPSGCGKTTTLRMIAGFEDPTSGSILISGKHVEHLPPNRRPVNTVFQNYALFPHLNIRQNIGFGLKLKKMKQSEINEKVEEVIHMVRLEEHADKSPLQLSGGQKQRVAIARAIVNNPKVLLLDEPLGALDLKLRKEMQLELKALQKRLGMTFVYVTHDQEEALTMSDRIIIMNKGNLEQIGTAREIYESPHTNFVAKFIGETNLFEDAVVTRKSGSSYTLEWKGITMAVESNMDFDIGEKAGISVRNENMTVSTEPKADRNSIPVRYSQTVYVGNLTKHITLLSDGSPINAVYFSEKAENYAEGSEVYVNWKPENGVLIKVSK